MKRVRCPKCDNFITFDETKYQAGQSLVFVCPNCNKQFGIRMGVSKLRETRKEEKLDEKTLIRRQKIRTKRKLFIMIYRIESLPD